MSAALTRRPTSFRANRLERRGFDCYSLDSKRPSGRVAERLKAPVLKSVGGIFEELLKTCANPCGTRLSA